MDAKEDLKYKLKNLKQIKVFLTEKKKEINNNIKKINEQIKSVKKSLNHELKNMIITHIEIQFNELYLIVSKENKNE